MLHHATYSPVPRLLEEALLVSLTEIPYRMLLEHHFLSNEARCNLVPKIPRNAVPILDQELHLSLVLYPIPLQQIRLLYLLFPPNMCQL